MLDSSASLPAPAPASPPKNSYSWAPLRLRKLRGGEDSWGIGSKGETTMAGAEEEDDAVVAIWGIGGWFMLLFTLCKCSGAKRLPQQ